MNNFLGTVCFATLSLFVFSGSVVLAQAKQQPVQPSNQQKVQHENQPSQQSQQSQQSPSADKQAGAAHPRTLHPLTMHPLTIQQAEERIKKNPKDIEALLSRADYKTRTHQTSIAIEDYVKILSLEPTNLEALEKCAKLNISNKQWASAVANFNLLEKIAPRAEIFSDAGDAKFQIHDYVGASRDWQESHKLKPESMPYLERAGFGNYWAGKWLDGAICFDQAFRSTGKATAWPLADASFAYIGYGLAKKKDLQDAVIKDATTRTPADMDLFDVYTIDYLSGKIDADSLIKKREGDPYYLAQANFFVGFNLAGQGRIEEARTYLAKCNIGTWAATEDFKLPLEAIAQAYLLRTK